MSFDAGLLSLKHSLDDAPQLQAEAARLVERARHTEFNRSDEEQAALEAEAARIRRRKEKLDTDRRFWSQLGSFNRSWHAQEERAAAEAKQALQQKRWQKAARQNAWTAPLQGCTALVIGLAILVTCVVLFGWLVGAVGLGLAIVILLLLLG